MMLRIAGFEPESMVDGLGVRFTLFLQGCGFRCPGCHNQETWDGNKGTLISDKTIYELIKANPLLSGVTLSGGEPFLQAFNLIPLVTRLKQDGYNIWCYTGFKFEELIGTKSERFKPLLEYIDVLVDGRFELANKSLDLRFKGSSNQRIINVSESLKQGQIILFPI